MTATKFFMIIKYIYTTHFIRMNIFTLLFASNTSSHKLFRRSSNITVTPWTSSITVFLPAIKTNNQPFCVYLYLSFKDKSDLTDFRFSGEHTASFVMSDDGFPAVFICSCTRCDLTPLRPRSSSSCRSLSSSPPEWTNSRSKGAAASSTTLTWDQTHYLFTTCVFFCMLEMFFFNELNVLFTHKNWLIKWHAQEVS